ncbi:MAG TPA: DUF222 domain-containing protein [Kofleriaceae bacterium]|nr:DUF222 domain-containing protein [Kofleriaceae bacterium]
MVNVMGRPGDVKRAAMRALGDQIAEEAAHFDAAMHRLLTHIREFDAAIGWGHAGAQSCAHWLSWRVGWTLGTGREHVRVARRLGELPRVDEALRLGKLSYAKARAITRVASAATEELLLGHAFVSTGACGRSTRSGRSRAATWTTAWYASRPRSVPRRRRW